MKRIAFTILCLINAMAFASSQQIRCDPGDLESRIMKQAEKDFGDPKRFYLFTLREGFETGTTNRLKAANSTVFNYAHGFTLRIYVIAASEKPNRAVVKLYHIPFNEDEEKEIEPVLVKEYKETVTDGKVYYFEYLMKSDDDHRLLISFEKNTNACGVLVATVNNQIPRRKTTQ